MTPRPSRSRHQTTTASKPEACEQVGPPARAARLALLRRRARQDPDRHRAADVRLRRLPAVGHRHRDRPCAEQAREPVRAARRRRRETSTSAPTTRRADDDAHASPCRRSTPDVEPGDHDEPSPTATSLASRRPRSRPSPRHRSTRTSRRSSAARRSPSSRSPRSARSAATIVRRARACRTTTSRRARVTTPTRRCPASSATPRSPATARPSAHPFRHIDQLAPGDQIIVTMFTGDRFVYEVASTEIVGPDDYYVVTTTDPTVAELTLTSCDPMYTARNRIAVHAFLVALRVRPCRRADVLRPRSERQRELRLPVSTRRSRPESTDASASAGDVATVDNGLGRDDRLRRRRRRRRPTTEPVRGHRAGGSGQVRTRSATDGSTTTAPGCRSRCGAGR